MNATSDNTVDALRKQVSDQPGNFDAWMNLGAALHQGGQREQALAAFERAYSLQPAHPQAVSACATLLFELKRPQAAYDALAGIRNVLLADADGATNLGIAADAIGRADEALTCYATALKLNPQHVGALNNLGLIHGRIGQWPAAVANAQPCVELLPSDPGLWRNWVDVLIGAREFAKAAEQAQLGLVRHPGWADLAIRHAVALAFNGDLAESTAAFDALGRVGPDLLRIYLEGALEHSGADVQKMPLVLPSPADLFLQQAFLGMQYADWRQEARVVQTLRSALESVDKTGALTDWRDTQFNALMLPLTELEQRRIRAMTDRTLLATLPRATPWRPLHPWNKEARIKIGLATQTLSDPRHANALLRQLSLHDQSRFEIHLYSPTPKPSEALSAPFRPYCENIVELSYLTHAEAAQRIRLDRLDLWLDMGFYTPWCRVEVAAYGLAPIQIFTQNWDRYHPDNPDIPCEYSFGDAFTHPDMHVQPPYGPIVRLPASCWLAANDDEPEDKPLSRADLGIPEDALMLSAFVPALTLDPETFVLWMRLLRALPQARLWLPAYNATARGHLAREATAAGVAPERIHFLPRVTRRELLACTRLANIFLDTLRFNANHGLVDALRMGVPAVSCAGHNMASRLGGSIIRAAGLADCVVDSQQAYFDKVVQMGSQPAELAALKARLASGLPGSSRPAALFDTAARVRELEAAWVTMVERQRAGLPPAAFDVPGL